MAPIDCRLLAKIRPNLIPASHAAPREWHGFTLLELLIALLLLSLVFLLLASGLQVGTRVWREPEERGTGTSDTSAVQNLLRSLLGGIRPVMVETAADVPRHLFFAGHDNSVRFVAPLPGHLGVGGFYDVTIDLAEGNASGHRVEMSWRVFRDVDASQQPLLQEERRTLIDGVAQMQFAYFGSRQTTEAPRWYDDWGNPQSLPALIRVRLKFVDSDRDWPDLLVTPMVQSVKLLVLQPESGE